MSNEYEIIPSPEYKQKWTEAERQLAIAELCCQHEEAQNDEYGLSKSLRTLTEIGLDIMYLL